MLQTTASAEQSNGIELINQHSDFWALIQYKDVILPV